MTTAVPRRPQDLEGYYTSSQLPGARGATAGIPGAWTPVGSIPPGSPADLMAGRPFAVTPSPATAWTTGQYVQTRTAGAPGRATWTGSAWVGGVAALEGERQAPDVDPGAWTIPEVEAWVEESPDAAALVLDAERARGDAARTTLVSWLETRLEGP